MCSYNSPVTLKWSFLSLLSEWPSLWLLLFTRMCSMHTLVHTYLHTYVNDILSLLYFACACLMQMWPTTKKETFIDTRLLQQVVHLRVRVFSVRFFLFFLTFYRITVGLIAGWEGITNIDNITTHVGQSSAKNLHYYLYWCEKVCWTTVNSFQTVRTSLILF